MKLKFRLIESKQDDQNFKNWLLSDTETPELANSIFDKFNKYKQSNRFDKPIKNDYYYWIKNHTVKELEDELEKIDNTKSNSQIRKDLKSGAKLIFQKDGYKGYKVTTYEAMKYLGAGTEWCITSSRRWGTNEKDPDFGRKYFKSQMKGDAYYVLITPNKLTWTVNDNGVINEYSGVEKYCVQFQGEIQDPVSNIIPIYSENDIWYWPEYIPEFDPSNYTEFDPSDYVDDYSEDIYNNTDDSVIIWNSKDDRVNSNDDPILQDFIQAVGYPTLQELLPRLEAAYNHNHRLALTLQSEFEIKYKPIINKIEDDIKKTKTIIIDDDLARILVDRKQASCNMTSCLIRDLIKDHPDIKIRFIISDTGLNLNSIISLINFRTVDEIYIKAKNCQDSTIDSSVTCNIINIDNTIPTITLDLQDASVKQIIAPNTNVCLISGIYNHSVFKEFPTYIICNSIDIRNSMPFAVRYDSLLQLNKVGSIEIHDKDNYNRLKSDGVTNVKLI